MRKERSQIQRHSARRALEPAAEFLAAGRVAHLGFAGGEQPITVPFGYHFDPAQPDRLYLHGSQASGALRLAASGILLSVTVMLRDGLAYAKAARYDSLDYGSVVCFGQGRLVTDRTTKRRVLEGMIRRYFPARANRADFASAVTHEKDTLLVEVAIEEWSAKAREIGSPAPLDAAPVAMSARAGAPL